MNLAFNLLKTLGLRQQFSRFLSSNGTTIYSLSSGYGKCGVSIIRVSGPQTKQALRKLIKSDGVLKERHAYLRAFHHPQTNDIIDKGLVLWFPGPHSFTGEDSCEFQVHGSLAVIAAMLDALGKVSGLQAAAPGEFTKRAYFGGKLDLTEVEGLADLIHAETEAQRKQALLQSTGALSRIYDNWRKRLIRCAAHLEAYIDFAEDENIEHDVVVQLTKELNRIIAEIRVHLDDQRRGEMLRDGIRTAIIGAPNVGKSSFLNLMCQRKISIVTSMAGTTRDVIETMHNFGGFPVVFSDTAGLRRQTKDLVELEGIARAKDCVQKADLILLLIDAQHLLERNVFTDEALTEYVKEYVKELDLDASILEDKQVQWIVNKMDLLTGNELHMIGDLKNACKISCVEEENIGPFLNNFEEILQKICGLPSPENPRISQARYRQQLERCIDHIKIFLTDYSPDIYPDMAISASKLRNAVRCIERITGHVSSEDILEVVFKDFCIGK